MTAWFYDSHGDRVGPFTREQILSFHEAGEINDSTLVWNKITSPEWQPFSLSGLAVLSDEAPPPLPASHINNLYAWLFALVPLFGLFVERVLSDTVPDSQAMDVFVFLLYGAAYIVLGLLDAKQIELSGRSKKWFSLKLIVWVAPLYLFRRARSLGQKQYLGVVWLGANVASFAISEPALLQGNIYLGVGLPTCQAGGSIKQVRSLFSEIPLMRLAGVNAIEVTSPSELSQDGNRRNCQATVLTSTGSSVIVGYTITEEENQYYYRLQIQQ